MNHIIKIGLLASIIGIYSCHSPNKVVKTDTSKVIDTINKITTTQISSESTEVDRDTSNNPLLSKIIFPDFSIRLNNIAFITYKSGNNKYTHNGDTIDTRNYKVWILSTKSDTIHLKTDDDKGLNLGKIEIVPKNKSDRFEISYSFKLAIIAENGKNDTLWQSMMSYKKTEDSLNYFFKSPEHNYIYSEEGKKINEIKKRFNLRDTTFKKEADNGDYGTYMDDGVIFKNQLCEIPYTTLLYLKIDRFIEDRLAETKYLVVDFSIPE
ncbi:hypothetical protein [Mucilaginibacter sp.]